MTTYFVATFQGQTYVLRPPANYPVFIVCMGYYLMNPNTFSNTIQLMASLHLLERKLIKVLNDVIMVLWEETGTFMPSLEVVKY